MKPSSPSHRSALDPDVLTYRDRFECSTVIPSAPCYMEESLRSRGGRALAIGIGSIVASLAALFSQFGR